MLRSTSSVNVGSGSPRSLVPVDDEQLFLHIYDELQSADQAFRSEFLDPDPDDPGCLASEQFLASCRQHLAGPSTQQHTLHDTRLGSDSFRSSDGLRDAQITRISRIRSFPNKLHRQGKQFIPPSLKHANSAPHQPPSVESATMPPKSRKVAENRKKGPELRQVPQILEGMKFYFFPNNTANGPRRARIEKAIQFGATRIDEFSDQVTHIIVDNALNYKHLLDSLKLKKIPEHVFVVNQEYPSDCMMYRTVIEATRSRFRVDGAPSDELKNPTNQIPESHESQTPDSPTKPSQKAWVTSDELKAILAMARRTTKDASERSISPISEQYDDELSKEIDAQKCLPGTLLASEEDETTQSLSQDDESDSERPPRKKRKEKRNSFNENSFLCMGRHENESKADNPNNRTIELLQKLAEYYDRTQDQWRSYSYRRAIGQLKKQTEYIRTKKDAQKLSGVGESIASKIEEIVWTDKLTRLENALEDPHDQVLQKFTRIYGVGYSQASRWVDAKYKTLDDLLKHAKLSPSQKIGIAHYDDFLERISRDEVKQHGEIVRKCLQEYDKDFQVIIGGSYRRGSKTCGDIDLIITKQGIQANKLQSTVLGKLVPHLFDVGFLKAELAAGYKDGGSKWHGCSTIPGSNTWRRIDFLLVPWAELGASMIYFTGNDIFNRSLRLLARKKGMSLNQKGLFKNVLRGPGMVKHTEGELIEGHSEKKIFELLGVPYRPPEHRVC